MDQDLQLTPHFKLGEFFARVDFQRGRTFDAVSWEFFNSQPEQWQKEMLGNLKHLAMALEQVRERFRAPIFINNGYRCPAINKLVGGKPRSFHLLAKAADIEVAGLSSGTVQRALDATWGGGLGYGKGFTHLDIRGYKARFRY